MVSSSARRYSVPIHHSRVKKSRAFTRLAPCRSAADFFQYIAEVRDILKILVHRGKADVGDLVHLVELAHHHLAHAPRSDLALAQAQQLLSDALDGGIHVL